MSAWDGADMRPGALRTADGHYVHRPRVLLGTGLVEADLPAYEGHRAGCLHRSAKRQPRVAIEPARDVHGDLRLRGGVEHLDPGFVVLTELPREPGPQHRVDEQDGVGPAGKECGQLR
eukprot:CAMPEP_0197923102 /NCGR_PEP_ID=MMETSP1439-20131203/93417_1 /TAXON_ID=66791 /ORGANISM="Gonyaulax spinifera, Strain CCMP409" /LENGTH=117 /DNA_ID=CAMNT_0043545449 /DNA_START=46 /DNA_END=395 /DNA_ORIENTATION=-